MNKQYISEALKDEMMSLALAGFSQSDILIHATDRAQYDIHTMLNNIEDLRTLGVVRDESKQ